MFDRADQTQMKDKWAQATNHPLATSDRQKEDGIQQRQVEQSQAADKGARASNYPLATAHRQSEEITRKPVVNIEIVVNIERAYTVFSFKFHAIFLFALVSCW